jgi:nucleoside-diphosphate-sugar epimerase
MDYLVTGGAGFIGSHLVERLVGLGRSVRVVDNFLTGRRENLAPFAGRFEMIEGDLSDPAVCARACAGVRVVLHQAAQGSVPRSVDDPATSHRHNVQATFNLLNAAREAGVKRFIFAASSSAYGESPTLPKVETMPPAPLSPYAVQKLMGEYYCSAFWRCYGMETISLRYFNVFGPRQNPQGQYAAVIPAFITAMLAGRPPTIYGDGEQSRDFSYIDNVVDANLAAVDAKALHGEVVNVACHDRVTLNEVVVQLNRLLGTNIQPTYAPARAGDIKHSFADIRLAEQVIGYRPTVTFAAGLARTIAWYRQHLESHRADRV